jgi:xanthine/uracil permease
VSFSNLLSHRTATLTVPFTVLAAALVAVILNVILPKDGSDEAARVDDAEKQSESPESTRA